MGTFRLYTGMDGQSHIETIDLDKTASWTAGLQTTNITFRSAPETHAPNIPQPHGGTMPHDATEPEGI